MRHRVPSMLCKKGKKLYVICIEL